jgi:hypothetical protein
MWNAKDYAELSNPKFLDIGNVDYVEFERIFNEYDDRLMETRKFLLGLDEDILSKDFDSKEYATKKMFSKLVTLPLSP